MSEEKKDIWHEGVKNYCAKSKLSLLCYIDEILPQTKSHEEKERFGRVKARIHNELSQLSLEIRILFKLFQAGGDISPFREEIIRREPENKAATVRKKFSKLGNTVLASEEQK